MNELIVILSCTWKFAFTFPFAIYIMQMSYMETLIYTNIGGILGVIFFSFISGLILRLWEKYFNPQVAIKRKEKPVFTRKRRMFVKIKSRYGLAGIVVLNPVILSIPVSSFLIAKYYKNNKISLLWLIFGQICWSFVYAYFYMFIKKAF